MQLVCTALPLGHDYLPIDGSRPPQLEASLEQLGPEAAGYLRALPNSPVCLMDFQMADASSLPTIESGSADILVQESLLNRAPHCLHEPIMAEAARVLRPGGLGFINFTDHQKLGGRFRLRHPRPGARAYGLRDLPPVLREGLFQEAVLLEADPARLTLITAPNGDFEFYFPFHYVTRLFESHGLQLLIHRQWAGCGGRHLTLVRKRG